MHKPGLIDLSISFLCSVDQALESDKLRRESSPILFLNFRMPNTDVLSRITLTGIVLHFNRFN